MVSCHSENGQPELKEFNLQELKDELVIISPGQKIGYVVDTVFNPENNKRIVELVRGADRFFCESPFLAEEEERGRDRYHLTSRQAGTLARMAGVKLMGIRGKVKKAKLQNSMSKNHTSTLLWKRFGII